MYQDVIIAGFGGQGVLLIGNLLASDPVEQYVDLDTVEGALRQGVGELDANVSRPIDVSLERDRHLCRRDCFEH